ncbi:MAG: universal stress protein [Actinomycetota bacterium]|nr:universal stress protein [Actinomycetota bacterium]
MSATAEKGPARARAFRRILVGYDGSKAAQDALRAAVALAEEIDGDVRVLLVARPPAHVETPEELASTASAERDNLSQGLEALLRPGLGGAPETRVVFADDPARAIAEHAEMHGFDLVVVGRHGREQATHRGIGQTLGSLVRHHSCPVLVV